MTSAQAKADQGRSRDLTPLHQLQYQLELIQESLLAVRIEQEAAFARGDDVKRLIVMARRAVNLRERRASIRQQIAETEHGHSAKKR